jgi:hypothetical protein
VIFPASTTPLFRVPAISVEDSITTSLAVIAPAEMLVIIAWAKVAVEVNLFPLSFLTIYLSSSLTISKSPLSVRLILPI